MSSGSVRFRRWDSISDQSQRPREKAASTSSHLVSQSWWEQRNVNEARASLVILLKHVRVTVWFILCQPAYSPRIIIVISASFTLRIIPWAFFCVLKFSKKRTRQKHFESFMYGDGLLVFFPPCCTVKAYTVLPTRFPTLEVYILADIIILSGKQIIFLLHLQPSSELSSDGGFSCSRTNP